MLNSDICEYVNLTHQQFADLYQWKKIALAQLVFFYVKNGVSKTDIQKRFKTFEY